MDAEDDLFYAELSWRISLIIMDEDDVEQLPLKSTPRTVQQMSLPHVHQSLFVPAYRSQVGYSHSHIISRGTGVFIPRSTAAKSTPDARRENSKSRLSSIQTINANSPEKLRQPAKSFLVADNSERAASLLYKNHR